MFAYGEASARSVPHSLGRSTWKPQHRSTVLLPRARAIRLGKAYAFKALFRLPCRDTETMEPGTAGEAFPLQMLWRHVMAGGSGRWLVTASLLGVLASPSASLAQTERAWVDPPPEAGSQTPTPAPSAAPPSSPPPPAPQAAAPDPAPAAPQQASTAPSAGAGEEKKDVPSPSPTAARKPDSENPAKQKAAAERKVRSSPPRQASSPVRSRKEEQSARRREPAAESSREVSRAEPRSRVERRARITRYGTIQEEGGSDLQLMRLRTIQLPDGRRIDILTRPDQDIASELPDGY